VARLWAGCTVYQKVIPGRCGDYFSSTIHTGSAAHSASYLMGTRGSLLKCKVVRA
jgi:hypothetical protein